MGDRLGSLPDQTMVRYAKLTLNHNEQTSVPELQSHDYPQLMEFLESFSMLMQRIGMFVNRHGISVSLQDEGNACTLASATNDISPIVIHADFGFKQAQQSSR